MENYFFYHSTTPGSSAECQALNISVDSNV